MDGVIRDIAEVREMSSAVLARGVIPIRGATNMVEPLNQPVRCGGVTVRAGDIIVADEEGILAVPRDGAGEVLETAQAGEAREADESLDAWETATAETSTGSSPPTASTAEESVQRTGVENVGGGGPAAARRGDRQRDVVQARRGVRVGGADDRDAGA